MKRIDLPENELRRLYVDLEMPMKEVALCLGTTVHCVRANLVRLGIDVRSIVGSPTVWDVVLTKGLLQELYIDKEMSPHDIAEDVGCCVATVFRYLKAHGIRTRGKGQAARVSWKGRAKYRYRTPWGYVALFEPDHPCATNSGYVLEHRKAWFDFYGELPAGWVVHHLNGKKDDNRIENLLAMPSKHHARLIPLLMSRIAELEDKISPPPATCDEKRLYTKLLRGKYGDEIVLELGPGRIAGPRGHATIGLNPSADPYCDIFFDLSRGIPLEDGSVTKIVSNQVIEHIRRESFIQHMNDEYRVLKIGGTCEHCVPDFRSPYAWGDPTHQTIFTPKSFEYFCIREDGTPFVEQFSDYGITAAFRMISHRVRPGIDIVVVMEKPR